MAKKEPSFFLAESFKRVKVARWKKRFGLPVILNIQ